LISLDKKIKLLAYYQIVSKYTVYRGAVAQ